MEDADAVGAGWLAASATYWITLGAGTFTGSCDCLHLLTYGRRGGTLFDGRAGAALYALGRALVIRLN